MPRPTPLLVVALVLVAPAGAAAQTGAYPDTRRPHATVTLRSQNGVVVDQLRASVRRQGDRLAVRATLVARRPSGPRSFALRIGSCPNGPANALRCPSTRVLRFTITPDARTTPFAARVRVGRAVRIWVNRPGARDRPIDRGASAMLELPDEAWSGALAGRDFGATVTPNAGIALTQLQLDAIGIRDGAVRPTQRVGLLSPAAATLDWACTGSASCMSQAAPLPAGREKLVQRRPFLTTAEAVVGMTGSVAGAPLFSAELPRPEL